MQFSFGGNQPLGVVYNTTMNRPDAALALALLYGFEGKREARMMGIAISGSGLGSAAFADAVARFYATGLMPNSNRFLPVGLAANGPLPADTPMVKAVLERRNEKGEPAFATGIHRITDTSEVLAMMRNAFTGVQDGNGVLILSAPATHLARVLDLPGTRDLMNAKVRRLIVVDSGAKQDVVAARKLFAEFPKPIVYCGRELGEALPFPGASIEKDFAWSTAHPVVDAYRAFNAMPYDAPSWDVAAAFYAVHPDSPMWKLSEPGTIQADDNGAVRFTLDPAGKHRSLLVDPAQKEKIIETFVQIASAKPIQRMPFRRPQNADVEKKKAEADNKAAEPAKTPDPVKAPPAPQH